ncbi:MAG: Rieske (2Fe-2S) protein [Acidobacteriota bacterium]|nr:Rieske (2Fe-2S) protein [Acidobacteriota bacterium]
MSAMPAHTRVCGASEIPEGGRVVAQFETAAVGVFRLRGELYAWENRCPHMGGPVCQGTILPRVVEKLTDSSASCGFAFDESDMHIVCPWHGFEFSIATGRHAAHSPVRLRAIPVKEVEGEVYVELP